MNDSELVRKLRQIDAYQQKVTDLIYEIEESDHPHATEVAAELWQQCWFAASAQYVAREFLDRTIWALWRKAGANYGYLISRQLAKKRGIETMD